MAVDVFNEEAVAALLGCSITTVRDRARSGELPGLKFGDRGWVFPAGALAARLDQLALEEAERRRQPAAKSGVLVDVSAGRKKRTPPALPTMP